MHVKVEYHISDVINSVKRNKLTQVLEVKIAQPFEEKYIPQISDQ